MKKEPTEERDLRKLAAKASALDREPQAAIAALRAQMVPADFPALADLACGRLIYEARHGALRWLLKSGPFTVPTPAANGASLQPRRGPALIDATADVAARSILRLWTLPNGTPIGRATGAKLEECAERDEEIGRGVLVRVATFRALAAKSPGEKIVGDHVTDDEAWKIYQDAEKRIMAAGHADPDTHPGNARRHGTNGHAGTNGNGKAKGTNGAGQPSIVTHRPGARPVGKR